MYQLSNSRIFQGFLYCFLGAVFLELILPVGWKITLWQNWLILVIGLIFFSAGYKKRAVLLLFFSILGLFLGFFVTIKQFEKIHHREEAQFSGLGYVFEEPQFKEDYQKLVICPILSQNKVFYPRCQEKVLLFDNLENYYNLGEIIEVDCQLKNPENKYPKFNYINFLAKDKIYQICQGAKIKKINPEKSQLSPFYRLRNEFYRIILKSKKGLEERIKFIFSYPESAYLSGLLLGGEDRLPENIQEDFRRTGVTHTIAVSGYNITILAGFFMGLGILVGFYRQKAFWLAALGVVFFVLMIGSPNSAVRAAVMGILLLWAAKKGRLADSTLIIVVAAALMVAFSPLILLYDVGFQLSFLASLSIVSFYGPISDKFNIKSDFLELKSIFLVTVVAQIGVLGVIFYNFETFSPVSLLANLLILPIIPAIMLFGFLVLILSFLSLFLASFVALPVQMALSLEIAIISLISKIPWASINIGDIGTLGLVVYYTFFVILLLYFKKKLN